MTAAWRHGLGGLEGGQPNDSSRGQTRRRAFVSWVCTRMGKGEQQNMSQM